MLNDIIVYFIKDVVFIIALLFLLVGVMVYLRTYIPLSRVRQILSGKRAGIGNLTASLLGAITPFCSCSSIPIFMSFLEAGVPLGVALSFLITSPLVNEYVVILMLGFFGLKITTIYVVSGIAIGIIAGLVLGRLGLEKYLVKIAAKRKERKFNSQAERLHFGYREALNITRKLFVWIIGVALGALIHNYIPEATMNSIISSTGLFAVPLAVLVGVPIYGNSAALVPVVQVLFEKGIPQRHLPL